MGNYKFRFSDMIPNAWFHKLKDMNKQPRSHYYSKSFNKKLSSSSSSSSPPPSQSHTSEFSNKQPHLSDQRKSYYFARDLTFQPDSTRADTPNPLAEPPRKSSRPKRRRSIKKNPPRLIPTSAVCNCRVTFNDSPPSPEESTNQSSSSEPDSVLTEYGSDRELDSEPDRDHNPISWSDPCKCSASNDGDHRRLPPIITKKHNEPTKIHQRTSAEFSETNAYGSLSVKVVKEDFLAAAASPVRRFPAKSPSAGVKLRVNSPKIMNRRAQGRRSVSSSSSSGSRRSISESFAVVKASKDPRRDFKESMVEMIVENNIKASKDLEELLACYLSLNSDEYHDLIIQVFKQIWFDFVHLRLN